MDKFLIRKPGQSAVPAKPARSPHKNTSKKPAPAAESRKEVAPTPQSGMEVQPPASTIAPAANTQCPASEVPIQKSGDGPGTKSVLITETMVAEEARLTQEAEKAERASVSNR